MREALQDRPVTPARMALPMTHRASTPPGHQSVMAAPVLHYLDPRPGALIVDATAGGGGHSLAIIPKLLPHGRLIAIDRDPEALQAAQTRLVEFDPQTTFLSGNFRDLRRILTDVGVAHVDGLLLDLGMSSLQVDDAARGFSFSKEGPLDMRMDRDQLLSASTIITEWAETDLVRLLEAFGEEPFARRIARRITQARRQQRIDTTTQLVRLVASAVPLRARHGRLHVATRTFQALRVAVNDELAALEEILKALPDILASGGRAVVLTYHSLEDRLVKQAFTQGQRSGVWTVLTKKPIRPDPDEVARNPRARSAKLRAINRPR